MRDYAKLSKALRMCKMSIPCTECPFYSNGDSPSKECGTMNDAAADAIEELLARDVVPTDFHERCLQLEIRKRIELEKQVPTWHPVSEKPTRTNPMHARDTFLVRLESGHIMTLSYEYDNSDRCTPGMVPLFDEGWAKTVVPVTHWMPLPEPPKGVE